MLGDGSGLAPNPASGLDFVPGGIPFGYNERVGAVRSTTTGMYTVQTDVVVSLWTSIIRGRSTPIARKQTKKKPVSAGGIVDEVKSVRLELAPDIHKLFRIEGLVMACRRWKGGRGQGFG